MWIFGYGSLMWRPGFGYQERAPAALYGYRRAFWQASPDHRGTPERPGRVVTLVRAAGARCDGVAFRPDARALARVLDDLDHRERGGYVRHRIRLETPDGRRLDGVTYLARPDNPHFLGEASLSEMVAQVRSSRGESGENADYVLRLARELQRLGIDDPHAQELALALEDAGLT